MHLAQSARCVHPHLPALIYLNRRVKQKGGLINADRVTFVRKTDFYEFNGLL